MSDFVHLHLHSEYSLLDGAIRIKDLLNKTIDYNMPAVAITDHGNMFGTVEFCKTFQNKDIKPIVGCEVYIAKGSRFNKSKSKNSKSDESASNHLVLLAENYTGYKNLMALVSLGYLEGFYYKPRVDFELLEKYSDGLIALSACLKGLLPETLLYRDEKEAEQVLEKFLKIFKKDNFFIELMENGIPEQKEVNKKLFALAQKYSIPVVATNDCHYLTRDMVESHDVLLCIQTGKTISDSDRMKFSTGEFYFKSPEEMKEAFKDYPEAISNTLLVAQKCNFVFERGKYLFPQINLKKDETIEEKFEKKAIDGLKERLPEIKMFYENFTKEIETQYWERLKKEIQIIKDMGFSGYFLIVEDFINYAKRNNIPVGPGRGSAAGSLVAYALRITDINPIPYNLLFERFLNPERVSMPDIDVDFCNKNRDKVIEYVTNKYGRDKVAQIVTFGKMKAKAVVRDVGRVLDMPYKEVDKIAKMIPDSQNITLKKALEEEEELKNLVEKDKKIKKLIEISMNLEGISRHSSTHAAGIVISNKPLLETVPLAQMKEGEVVTQYNMKYLEDVGLIKFDFLGLKNLTTIANAVELINEKKKDKLDISKIPLNDKKTYSLISSGRTIGIFQLESSGMRELIKRLKPDKFEDLIALVALYRPGPLGSGMVDEFIEIKHGKRKANYALPELEPILKETYGLILYQEQVMQIAQKLADYTLGEADQLRRAMGKKNAKEMQSHKGKFLEGCKSKNIPEKIAEDIFEKMAKFAEYGFNKSHSAAYAYIAYQTAYLKAHYTVEFMTALLSEDQDNPDKVIKDINECKSLGIEILPPDVNESELDFTMVDNKIRFGLGAIKNVGKKAIESIIENRKKGKYTSLYNFCYKVDLNKVNKRVIESLIQSGAMDSLPFNRATKLNSLGNVMQIAMLAKKEILKNRKGLFGNTFNEATFEKNLKIEEVEEWEEKYKLQLERQLLGYYISSHPLNEHKDIIDEYSTTSIENIISGEYKSEEVKLGGIITSVKIIKTKKKNEKMAGVILEDLTGQIEMIIFPSLYEDLSELIKEDTLVFIKGNIDSNEESVKLIAKEIIPLQEVSERFTNKITLIFNNLPEKSIILELNKKMKRYKSEKGSHILAFKINIPEEGEVLINCPNFKLKNINNFLKNLNNKNKFNMEIVLS